MAVTANNIGLIDQQGSHNSANLFQTSTSGKGSNTATIGQYGNYNQVTGPGGFALQDGTGNKMPITQLADGGIVSKFNSATVSQSGTGNSLTLSQTFTTSALFQLLTFD